MIFIIPELDHQLKYYAYLNHNKEQARILAFEIIKCWSDISRISTLEKHHTFFGNKEKKKINYLYNKVNLCESIDYCFQVFSLISLGIALYYYIDAHYTDKIVNIIDILFKLIYIS